MSPLQKKSIRIITNSPYQSHTEPLFKRTGILKLTDQYKLNVLTFMYQHKNSKLPDSLDKLELVYLPVGKYCVYPRMVYRQAMAYIEYDLLSMCFMQHLIRCCIRRYHRKILRFERLSKVKC